MSWELKHTIIKNEYKISSIEVAIPSCLDSIGVVFYTVVNVTTSDDLDASFLKLRTDGFLLNPCCVDDLLGEDVQLLGNFFLFHLKESIL